jgi:hypothetical protein
MIVVSGDLTGGRPGRALGGMSGGAFAAPNIGLHRTGEFAALLHTMPFPHPVAAILTDGTGSPGDIATASPTLHSRRQSAVVHIERGHNHTWRPWIRSSLARLDRVPAA